MRIVLSRLTIVSLCLTSQLSASEFVAISSATGGWTVDARAMSSDGTIVAGMATEEDEKGQAFVWSEANGLEPLGALPGGDYSFASAVSGDGGVVAGFSQSSRGYEAFRWTRETGFNALGDLPGGEFDSHATGVSYDGTVIVGAGNADTGTEAFRWTLQDGMQPLGVAEWAGVSGARDVSGDGQTILVGDTWGALGAGNRYQSYLLSAGEPRTLIDLPDANMIANYGRSISRDGQVVVGDFDRLIGNTVPNGAFWWRSDYGLVDVGTLPGSQCCRTLYDVSGDGSVAVGQDWLKGQPVATIWDELHGVRKLEDVLAVDPTVAQQLAGWRLERTFAVSDNGRIVAGNGIDPQGGATAWRAVLDVEPPPALLPGDATLGGSVDLVDFGRLKDHFGGKGFWYQGDFNRDKSIDLSDFGVLKANFGTEGTIAVPEPSTLLLAASAALLMAVGRLVRARAAVGAQGEAFPCSPRTASANRSPRSR